MKNKTQTSKNSMEVVDLCPLKNKLFVMNVKVEIPVKKKIAKMYCIPSLDTYIQEARCDPERPQFSSFSVRQPLEDAVWRCRHTILCVYDAMSS